MSKVLIIDDDPTMVQVISSICSENGHTPIAYSSGQKAIAELTLHSPDLVLTDVRMDGVGGMEVLESCLKALPGTPVIMITANRQLQMGVEAMKAGAYDYITKPFKVDELRISMERALDHHRERREIKNLRQAVREKFHFDNIVGTSERMQRVFDLISKVLNTDSTILILGESGTGKELVARALHFNSDRQTQPFVAINCSALPENLLESELFGHKKGSFTGAVSDKVGLFEEAEGGTIFLDEVNSMSPLLQTKLLRVLQERTIRRVGDNKIIPIRVRVLAASNEPLYEKIKKGEFRQDLYYRLAVIPVEMPPLRERPEDVPLLVQHFIQKHALNRGSGEALRLADDVLPVLTAYRWPGNVRELENAMERACTLCEEGVIRVQDLPPHVLRSGANPAPSKLQLPIGQPLDDFISQLERRFILETIQQNNGSRERAAKVLEISTATLYRKIGEPKKRRASRETRKR